MTLFIVLLLASFAVSSVLVNRAYQSIPARELKKRARDGDEVAKLLYRSAAYGPSLSLILKCFVLVAHVIFFVYVSRATVAWFAALLSAAILWFGFIWLPARRVTSLTFSMAARISPVLARLASIIYPTVQFVLDKMRKLFPIHVHTGLYDQDDLIDLLDMQQKQPDNQVSASALEIAAHALSYASVPIAEVLVPRRAVHMVEASDTIGPVFMDELHKTGFSRFPVYEGNPDNIVGILYLRDLVQKKRSGPVSSVMKKEVLYIHEEQVLEQALSAILRTHQHLFIVVNGFEEYVGILTIEDVFERILGTQIVDEFDQYDDMRTVASRAAASDHASHEHPVEK